MSQSVHVRLRRHTRSPWSSFASQPSVWSCVLSQTVVYLADHTTGSVDNHLCHHQHDTATPYLLPHLPSLFPPPASPPPPLLCEVCGWSGGGVGARCEWHPVGCPCGWSSHCRSAPQAGRSWRTPPLCDPWTQQTSCEHTHTHNVQIHASMNAHTHIFAHVHTHTHSLSHTHTHTCMCLHARMHTHTHTHTHTKCIHAEIRKHSMSFLLFYCLLINTFHSTVPNTIVLKDLLYS